MKKKSYGKKLLAWVLALAVSMTLVPVMGQREVQAAKLRMPGMERQPKFQKPMKMERIKFQTEQSLRGLQKSK